MSTSYHEQDQGTASGRNGWKRGRDGLAIIYETPPNKDRGEVVNGRELVGRSRKRRQTVVDTVVVFETIPINLPALTNISSRGFEAQTANGGGFSLYSYK